MSEWKKVKLGEYIDVLSGFAFKSKDFSDTGIPVIKIKNVSPPCISLEDLSFVPEVIAFQNPRYILEKGDILIAMTGSHINQIASVVGRVGRVRYDDITVLNQRVGKIINKNDDLSDIDFIYYYLSQYEVKVELAQKAGGAANQANISPSDIKNLLFPCPPIEVQHRIATILSRYDTLIENYQKQIKLLEEAAQRLYKEWFVDLRFPGYENVKMVDDLPEGWERKKVGEVVTKSIGGGWGKETHQEQYDREGFVIRGTDISKLKNGSLNEIPFRYHTESNLKERTLSDGDIIFEVSGGSEKEPVGRMYLITQPILDYYCKDVICASFCKKVSFANKMISVLCYFAMQHCRNTGDMKKFEKDSAGNIINFAWTTFLEDFNVLLPNNEVLNAFYRRANAIINSEVKLSLQIRLLTEARDRLLPRLMGGEIEGEMEV